MFLTETALSPWVFWLALHCTKLLHVGSVLTEAPSLWLQLGSKGSGPERVMAMSGTCVSQLKDFGGKMSSYISRHPLHQTKPVLLLPDLHIASVVYFEFNLYILHIVFRCTPAFSCSVTSVRSGTTESQITKDRSFILHPNDFF